MKSTGMVRKVDELGRVVIPKELRRQFDIEDNKDSFEIYVDGNTIILKKYQPGCIFCGELSNITNHRGQYICQDCVNKIAKKARA